MIKKITLFTLLFYGFCFSQTIINDFETNSPVPVARYGAEISVVSNPNTSVNTSANVLKIGRTTSLWYELMAFNLATPYSIPAGETHYLSFSANYPASPDISIRFNAASAAGDGSGSQRAINTYDASASGQWQTIVFEVSGGTSGTTVNAIVFIGDVGFNNSPQGRVLNNTDAFGYVDNFAFNTANPLSTNQFSLSNNLSIYPNEVSSTFNISVANNLKISRVDVFNILGKKLNQNIVKISENKYDISSLKTGMYFIRLFDDEGNSATKKIIKK